MKRQLPSLTALECFENVMRHGLVTRAADELNLTQSAVSRQIGNLENFVRQPLFRRERKRLIPTEAAIRFSKALSPVMDTLEKETMRLMSWGAEDRILTLGLLPTFGSRWLIPRLGTFTTKYPDIQLNIVTGLVFEDFTEAETDVAVIYGKGEWHGHMSHRLMNEEVVPVIAPDLYENPDIMSYEHLQMATRPDTWRDWLAANDHDNTPQKLGPKFENFTMMIEAVRSGLGVAVLPQMYIDADLATGKLLAPFGTPATSRHGYYLVYPEHLSDSKKILAFKDWLFTTKV